jgi:hypothetical protein
MEADIKPDARDPQREVLVGGVEDRGETVSLMEPLLLGEGSRDREMLIDLAFDLARSPPVSRAVCLLAFLPPWPPWSGP